MKTALATLVVALAAPIAVTAAPGVPDSVLSAIHPELQRSGCWK